MTEISRQQITLEQHGVSGGIMWNEFSEFPHSRGIGNTSYAVVFDFNVANEASAGRVVDPLRPFTRPASLGTLGELAPLRIETDLILMDLENLQGFWVSTIPNPELWSTANLPEDVPDSQTAIIFAPILGSVPFDPSPVWVLNDNGTTYDLLFELDWNATLALVDGSGTTTLADITGDVSWNGRLAFWFQGFGLAAEFFINGTDMTCSTVPFNNGWLHAPPDRGRPLLDYKSGFPSFGPELAEDGYYRGLWTEARHWDPQDPREVEPVRLPRREQVPDDKVPQ